MGRPFEGGKFLRMVNRRRAPAPDALRVREADALVSKLLTQIRIDLFPAKQGVLRYLADLKAVLLSEYAGAVAKVRWDLFRELSKIVEDDLRPRFPLLSAEWNQTELLEHVSKTYGPRRIDICASPYRRGAGLALRGFYYRTDTCDLPRYLIYLNTAHVPVAIAATFGHELGHYVYGSIVGEGRELRAFVEGSFAHHLRSEDELFADSLVALAAYPRALTMMLGRTTGPGTADSTAFAEIF